jgi:hypothetical protein
MALCHVFRQVCNQVTLLNAFHITDSTPAVAQIKCHESRANLLSLLCVAGYMWIWTEQLERCDNDFRRKCPSTRTCRLVNRHFTQPQLLSCPDTTSAPARICLPYAPRAFTWQLLPASHRSTSGWRAGADR